MKIDRLDLKAYGPFTDHSLDLSTPGVHLIIGPNEAGKSTTLNAIEDALYGIHTRTTAGFLHGMQSLIIGLHLRQSNDAMLQFKRLKKNKGSLVRSDGSELSQTELDRFLGGIGRAEFSALYGIGHKDLAAGSKDLLAGKGDLGQAIFGASVGSVSLHSALKKLEERIGGLYRQTGKNVRLNAAITKYEESREDAKTHSLAPLEYGEALSRISDLEGAIQQRLASQRVLSEERLECQQLLEALERIRLRQKSIDRIEELRPTTDLLRIGIGEEFAEVRSALVTHRESVRRSNSEIESIEAAIDAVSTDPGVLEHWGEIGRLREGREQYKSQREGFPIAAEKVESTRRAVSALLARLGADPNIEAAQTVSVPRIAEARVLELADMEGELRVAFEKSRSSLMDATAKLQSQQRTLSEIAVLPDHRQLDSSLRGCRSGDDLTARRNAVTQELRSTQTKTTELAVDLGLGELSSSELLKLSVPTLATIEKFRDRLNVKSTELSQREHTLDELQDTLATTNDSLNEVLGRGDVPTEAELDEARARRDSHWLAIREEWTGGAPSDHGNETRPDSGKDRIQVANTYEATLAGADRLADQLRREADVVARRAALESERLDLDDKIAVATKSVDQCLATIATLEDEWIELWLPTGIVPADPGSMSNWRHSYSELARVAGQATQLAAELADIELRVQVQSDDLRQALTSVGVEVAPETPLPSLLERCDAELKDLSNRQKSLELANSQLKDLVDQVQQLTILSGQAKESLGIWQEDWAKALGAIGQSGFSPKQAREFLKDAESLAREIDNLADFQKSVDDLRDAISSYEQRLGAVAGELGDPAQGVDSLLVLDRLISRLAKAKSAQQDVETLRDRMATNMVRLGTEQADLESTQDRLQQLLNEVSVETESDLHLAIENSDLLRSHAETVEGLETELAALSNGRSADELEAAIGDRDQSDLRMTISDLDERISGLQEELLTEKSALGGAETERRRWDGSAAAANAANEAQFALAEIGELTQEYLGLQMAAELLKEHIRIFRERHQTPILDRATPWFKRLTMGRFQRIETDEDSHGDLVLEAVRSNGERIKVEGLSEGTLDQLYLSLRLAALAEAAANGEPFPVILDDLLITFDDDRARAAFEVLGELSTTTQILVFTHHEHLRQIALEALGAKKLTCHDLIPLDSVPS